MKFNSHYAFGYSCTADERLKGCVNFGLNLPRGDNKCTKEIKGHMHFINDFF
jgi:hypothetical protein